ncbi:MAG: nucleoside deaminase [Firmicutes bacterium]|nr:nucleoside deaminase [Bacillota bacterium]
MNIKYMNMAIEEAKKALVEDEVPVGCVIVKNDKVIAKAHNKKESMNKVTKHSEIIAIETASEVLNNWRLIDCDIYITLEPCPMCASAIKQARINNIYCGLSNLDENNNKIINEILKSDKVNKGVNVYNNIAVDKVKSIMQEFFQKQRKK